MKSRLAVGLLLVVVFLGISNSQTRPTILSVCELSRDFAAYRDQVVTVRGVYYDVFRQACPQKCSDRPWRSFLWFGGTSDSNAGWEALDNIQRTVEIEAKKGKRFEIWVTAVGQLKTRARHTILGPCDWIGSRYFGYGHLGAYPAELVVRKLSDIEVKENPNSPYDYANLYHGAL